MCKQVDPVAFPVGHLSLLVCTGSATEGVGGDESKISHSVSLLVQSNPIFLLANIDQVS